MFRIHYDYYFANKIILRNQNDFYSLCKELNNQGLIYVTLEPDEDAIPEYVSFLVQEREQISLIVNSPLVQRGRRSFLHKQTFIGVFALDALDGDQIRLDYEFGARVLKERIYNSHSVPVISPLLKTALFVQDILFFYEYNLIKQLIWISIPSKSIRNHYRDYLYKSNITDFSFANLMAILENYGLKPNLDYLLFQSRIHPQLLNFAQVYLNKYSLAPKGLSVFCILEKYSTKTCMELIVSYLKENGFINFEVFPLNEYQSSLATNRFRSGRWSSGTNSSNGNVRVLIAFIDPRSVRPNLNSSDYKFPIDNLRLQEHKKVLRKMLNSGVSPTKGTHIIHSSDCAPQALYYLLELGIDYVSL